jgi:streptomycin 6-kinase
MELPATFRSRISAVFGEEGERWLASLPEIVRLAERRWDVTLELPFELSYNYVAPGRRSDGSGVVLKVGVPGPEFRAEIEALRHFAGRGTVGLLDHDAEQGLALLERLEPGTSLRAVDDDEAVAVAAGLMVEIWRPPPDNAFPNFASWLAGIARYGARFEGAAGPLPSRLVDAAVRLSADLIESADPPVLLHGDLHHDNILAASRESWLAIDPKGVKGEPAFEIGAFLMNPRSEVLQWSDPRVVLTRRIDQFAALLTLDRQRLIACGLVRAVLSACWSAEDHGAGWEPAIAVAEALSPIAGRP